MKILFFASGSIYSNFTYRALSLAKALHELGHETTIVAPAADKYNRFVPEKVAVVDGVRIIHPFQFTTKKVDLNFAPYFFGAVWALLRERPELVYIYKPTPISSIGLLAKLLWRTPVVVDMDDLGSEVMKIEGHPWHRRKLVEWSERFSVANADRLVAASDYLYDIYRRAFPATPIHLMPNGAGTEWFGPTTTSGMPKQIVFMGSINRRSILEPLFDALPNILKHFPETKVVVIGDGKDLLYFKNKCTELHIEEHVEFTGWLDISIARSRLHEGDIGYNYMPREATVKAASNMKAPQYMARGVVPFMSDVNDLAARTDFETMGYVAPANDLPALEAGLLRALADKDRMSKAHRARSFAERYFEWSRLATEFNNWIAESGLPAKERLTKTYENAAR